MSEALGRPLDVAEIVHHRDEDKLNNEAGNLEMHTAASHRMEHDPNESRRVTLGPKTCPVCGSTFVKSIANHGKAKVCSIACRNAAGEHAVRRKITLKQELEAVALRRTMPRREIAARFGLSESGLKHVYARHR